MRDVFVWTVFAAALFVNLFVIVVNALVPPLSGFASVVCSWSATAALVLTLACFAMERKRT